AMTCALPSEAWPSLQQAWHRRTACNERHGYRAVRDNWGSAVAVLPRRTSEKLNGGESPRSRLCCMCRRFLVLDQANPTQSREPQETEAEQREGHRLRRLPGRLEAFVGIRLEHRVRPGEAVHGSHTRDAGLVTVRNTVGAEPSGRVNFQVRKH